MAKKSGSHKNTQVNSPIINWTQYSANLDAHFNNHISGRNRTTCSLVKKAEIIKTGVYSWNNPGFHYTVTWSIGDGC